MSDSRFPPNRYDGALHIGSSVVFSLQMLRQYAIDPESFTEAFGDRAGDEADAFLSRFRSLAKAYLDWSEKLSAYWTVARGRCGFRWGGFLHTSASSAIADVVQEVMDALCECKSAAEIPQLYRSAFASVAGQNLSDLIVGAEQERDFLTVGGDADAGSDPAEGEQAEGGGEQTRQQQMDSLAPAVRKAYLSFEVARLKAAEKNIEDWEAYQLLKEDGIPEDNRGELTDYQLPAKDTWCRQLRQARQALGEQKYSSRQGRPHGKSIVRQDQIEQPEKDG